MLFYPGGKITSHLINETCDNEIRDRLFKFERRIFLVELNNKIKQEIFFFC